jgi:hypothetical protein
MRHISHLSGGGEFLQLIPTFIFSSPLRFAERAEDLWLRNIPPMLAASRRGGTIPSGPLSGFP